MSDSIIAIFERLTAEGMTHAEAMREFDPERFKAALIDDIEQHGRDSQLLAIAVKSSREQMNETDMDKALELWLAGWKSETPHASQVDVMSWYWRRPSRRAGKPGRKFHSTDQAFNALKRDA